MCLIAHPALAAAKVLTFDPQPLTLTFIDKPDVLLMSWSESLRKVGRLVCGGRVVTPPVQAIEDDLRGWGAEDKNLAGLACVH